MKKIIILCFLVTTVFSAEKIKQNDNKEKKVEEFFVVDFSVASGYRHDRLNQFGKVDGAYTASIYQTNRLNIWQNNLRFNFTFPDIIKIGVDIGAGYIASGKVILDRMFKDITDRENMHVISFHGSHTLDIIPSITFPIPLVWKIPFKFWPMGGYIWREIKTENSTRTNFYLPFIGLRLIQPIYQFAIDAFCDYGFLGKRKETIRFWDSVSGLYRTLSTIEQNHVSCVYLGASAVYNFHPKMFCSISWKYNRLWGNKSKKVLINLLDYWHEKTHWQSNEAMFNFGYKF